MSSSDVAGRGAGILPSRLVAPGLAESGAPPTVVSEPVRRIDAETTAMLEDARARGEAEGHARGLAEGRSQLSQLVQSLADAMVRAQDRVAVEVAAQHAELAVALETRVMDAVRAVLDHEPGDEGRRLLAAVRRAVERVEAPTLVVRVAEDREAVARAGLDDLPQVEVETDPALGVDDVVIVGDDVDVDLRRERLLDELQAVLAVGGPLGPVRTGEGDDA